MAVAVAAIALALVIETVRLRTFRAMIRADHRPDRPPGTKRPPTQRGSAPADGDSLEQDRNPAQNTDRAPARGLPLAP
jgi:hypothetical protein